MPLRLSIPKWKFRKLELPQVDQRERPHLAFAFFCNGPCQFRVSIDPIDSIPLGNKLRLGRGAEFLRGAVLRWTSERTTRDSRSCKLCS